MTKPYISIITSTFNCADSLESTIKSVIVHLSQEIEYLIIDGGSTDGTVDIIKKYNDSVAYWISEKDEGIYDAWNKGLMKSRGQFVAFLGSGDSLCLNYSNLYLNKILINENIDFVSSKMIIRDKKNTIYGFPWEWGNFKFTMNVVHPGSIHNKKLYSRYGVYDNKYRIAGDYEFLLRIGDNLTTDFIDEQTVVFGLDGISSNNKLQLAREVRNAKIKNSVNSLILINIEYFIRIALNNFKNMIRIFSLRNFY
jgi:glycosyltransferase involved in cell wall biosynthesis